jgi:hypothetical protein
MDNKASLPKTAQYMYQVFNMSHELDQAKLITPKVFLVDQPDLVPGQVWSQPHQVSLMASADLQQQVYTPHQLGRGACCP